MDESRLCTIEQIQQFLSASTLVEFSKYGMTLNAMSTSVACSSALTTLSAGNTREPAAAYRAFRGRDPTVEAMLRKRGLAPSTRDGPTNH